MLMKTPNKLLAADLLEKAIEEITKRGRAQGELQCRDGSICLIGALCLVEFGDATKGYDAVKFDFVVGPLGALALEAMGLTSIFNAYRWNDDTRTSTVEVIEKMKAGIIVLRAST